jgi:hypothetical protein
LFSNLSIHSLNLIAKGINSGARLYPTKLTPNYSEAQYLQAVQNLNILFSDLFGINSTL